MSEPYGSEFRLQLSSLADGEVSVTEVATVCSAWRDDAHARRTWHTYQLIGDVLRSDELASSPARDVDFLAKLRDRLATEPVVLAPHAEVPQPILEDSVSVRSVAGGRRSIVRRWRMPVTVAASVLAVSGVLMVARVSGLMPGDVSPAGSFAQVSGSPAVATASPQSLMVAPSGVRTVSSESGPASVQPPDLYTTQPQTVAASRKVIRDSRLDEYLAAHKEFGAATALVAPSGFLRSATTESRDR